MKKNMVIGIELKLMTIFIITLWNNPKKIKLSRDTKEEQRDQMPYVKKLWNIWFELEK